VVATDEEILAMLASGVSGKQVKRRLKVGSGRIERLSKQAKAGKPTFGVYADAMDWAKGKPPDAYLPDPDPEAGGPTLPEPEVCDLEPYRVDCTGHALVLGDTHIPYHDKATIEKAVAEARRRNVSVVLLNGDVMDGTQFSRHRRLPNTGRFVDSAVKGKQFLGWLRSQFPRQQMIFKFGNHDEWLMWYMAEKAPEAFDLEGFDLESVLGVKSYGIDVVKDKRAVHLGKLPVFHGHEFRGGGGVNPARWLFLRINSTGMTHHFHRSSQHDEASYDGRVHGTWSVGCSCYLKPEYDRYNKWNHGYAMVELSSGGHFEVTSRKILRDGRVA
jgi:hypothetical protein